MCTCALPPVQITLRKTVVDMGNLQRTWRCSQLSSEEKVKFCSASGAPWGERNLCIAGKKKTKHNRIKYV